MNNQLNPVLAGCLHVLAERLTHHLPVCPTGTVCARALPVTLVDGQYRATLPVLEFGTLTLYSANGTIITLNQTNGPTIDYIAGTLTFPSDPGAYVMVDYQISLAEEFIQQAVADLSQRLPRKLTGHFITNASGITPLPPGLTRILSLCRVECGCACQPTNACHHICGDAPCFACHHCANYLSEGNLIQTAGPCQEEQFDICYLAGYPLDKHACYTGLTPDLVELVIYKALALAYRNPQMLLAISGLSTNSLRNANNSSSSSGSTGSGSSSNTETTTTIKTKDNCGKEEKTVTTKTGSATSSKLSSSTSSALSSLFSSSNNRGLADQYERLYLDAIARRTHIAALHLTPVRSGYKARFAARC